MKAAIVLTAGQTPVYGDFKAPEAGAEERIVSVTAAALSPVTKSRAAGTHYSASDDFPFVAGLDGVGRLSDGSRVYFILPKAPFGSMAEKTLVPKRQCLPLPDALDDVTAAALAIPGVSSWAAFKERAKLVAGETVLVNGATGASGKLAIQIAKHLSAKKVIATGRNPKTLETLKALGADIVISVSENTATMEKAFKEQFAEGVDVVIDYLWGSTAELLLSAGTKAGKEAVPIRYVQIGSVSGANITLPSAALRSSAITMMGSGIGSIPAHKFVLAINEVLQAAIPARFQIETKAVPLSQVEHIWTNNDSERIVFTL